jgi:hypothetical protein
MAIAASSVRAVAGSIVLLAGFLLLLGLLSTRHFLESLSAVDIHVCSIMLSYIKKKRKKNDLAQHIWSEWAQQRV